MFTSPPASCQPLNKLCRWDTMPQLTPTSACPRNKTSPAQLCQGSTRSLTLRPPQSAAHAALVLGGLAVALHAPRHAWRGEGAGAAVDPKAVTATVIRNFNK